MDTVNFKARYVDNAFVMAKAGKNRFIPKEVAVLKINMTSKSDRETLVDLSKKWAKKNNLIRIILLSLNSKPDKKRSIYVLSEQENNYRTLDSKKILGIAEVTNFKNICSLDFIQTNPKYEHTNTKRKIKDVGSALLDYITYKARNRETCLDSVDQEIGFYEKHGFKKMTKKNFYTPGMTYKPE